MLSLAAASSLPELLAAMAAMAASAGDGEEQKEDEDSEYGTSGVVLGQSAWAILVQCCEADLAGLPAWTDEEAAPPMCAAVAVEARRALVRAACEVARAQSGGSSSLE